MRIGIVSSNGNFAGGVKGELDRRGAEVIVYQHSDSEFGNAYQLGQLDTCDVIFVDFAQPPLEAVLSVYKGRVVVRVHRLEMYFDGLEKLPWSRVDNLVFIAEHVRERFMARLTEERPRSTSLMPHVGVNLDTFQPPAEPRSFEPPYRILIAGNQIPKKRQYTALQLLHDLPPEWHLCLVGEGGMAGYGNAEYTANCIDLIDELGIRDRVDAHPKVSHAELVQIMHGCTHVLSASNEEGCHTTVAEGMSTGLVPLVNCWRGAGAIYPKDALWRSPKGFYALCDGWLANVNKQGLSEWCVDYARDRFDAAKCDGMLADLIMGAGAAGGQQDFYDSHLSTQIGQAGNQRQQRCLAILRAFSKPGDRMLDVGCGVGYVANTAAHAGWRVLGIDLSPALIERALYTQAVGAEFAVHDVRQGVPGGPYDVITLFDSLEHIPSADRRAVMQYVVEGLVPGGKAIFTWPWGVSDGSQPYEWPCYPKTVVGWLQECGAKVVLTEPLDEEYWHVVVRRGEAL